MRNKLQLAALLVTAALSWQLAAQDDPNAGDPERGRASSPSPASAVTASKRNIDHLSAVPRAAAGRPRIPITSSRRLRATRATTACTTGMHAQAADPDRTGTEGHRRVLRRRNCRGGGRGSYTPPESGIYCVSCHGVNGVSITTEFPHLAGQHADYLNETIRQYLEGRAQRHFDERLPEHAQRRAAERAVRVLHARQPGLVTRQALNAEKRAEIFRRLRRSNPRPVTELSYGSPFELLVAVVLSAQATDVGVNKATKTLFAEADTPQAPCSGSGRGGHPQAHPHDRSVLHHAPRRPISPP